MYKFRTKGLSSFISTKMVDNKPAFKPLHAQKILFSFIKVPYLREINHIVIIIIINAIQQSFTNQLINISQQPATTTTNTPTHETNNNQFLCFSHQLDCLGLSLFFFSSFLLFFSSFQFLQYLLFLCVLFLKNVSCLISRKS